MQRLHKAMPSQPSHSLLRLETRHTKCQSHAERKNKAPNCAGPCGSYQVLAGGEHVLACAQSETMPWFIFIFIKLFNCEFTPNANVNRRLLFSLLLFMAMPSAYRVCTSLNSCFRNSETEQPFLFRHAYFSLSDLPLLAAPSIEHPPPPK